MIIETLLIIPLITAALCYLIKHKRTVEIVSTLGALAIMAGCVYLAYTVFTRGPVSGGLWYVDSLGAYMLVIISFIGLAAAIYSIGYLGYEYKEKKIDLGRLRYYFTFFHVFIFTMLLVCTSSNLGIMWIAIEATTLASAFLVGFYNKDTSVEAAWKYIIICSVGITLALLGTILLYASSVNTLGESADALNWPMLAEKAKSLDPTLLKIAFILVIIGYGTKAGFAPMHTWLPDAHSEAPTPISGLLSGVLLNCAMYGILRYHIITTNALGPDFSGTLLIVFGLLSLAAAAAFIIIQKDYKRLLAYSSIEHMGIIAIGFGIGGAVGIFGALLHILNHAVTKSLMFFGAGNILLKFKTKNIDEVKGIAALMPWTAMCFVAGALAITGSPPFSIFVSEIIILIAGFTQGNIVVSVLYLLLLVIIFAGFMYHVGRMVFGEPAPGTIKGEPNYLGLCVMAVLLLATLIMGVYVPLALSDILTQIVTIFGGSV
ncbi:hydrogenase 4 subunit F [Methanocella arvoryzae]|uniref:Hydrogenase, membrane subunit 1-like protein (EchA-like) n=1 Tax=Methanocella arvoryzae (strain DSM 22066 / NBRC 105507 / MRE50) TaxID=351160 RepID=Q0W2B8_METAR|nr:hydrogenase 4 subunit F [Methanocella arvoryzae]CAJ37475.1 hydrogenase, membrane subunit 1-like protein (EchA-like) [Methanocella arvoryzae MRE50]